MKLIKEDDFMNTALLDLADRLVSISDFSQGRFLMMWRRTIQNILF